MQRWLICLVHILLTSFFGETPKKQKIGLHFVFLKRKIKKVFNCQKNEWNLKRFYFNEVLWQKTTKKLGAISQSERFICEIKIFSKFSQIIEELYNYTKKLTKSENKLLRMSDFNFFAKKAKIREICDSFSDLPHLEKLVIQ